MKSHASIVGRLARCDIRHIFLSKLPTVKLDVTTVNQSCHACDDRQLCLTFVSLASHALLRK